MPVSSFHSLFSVCVHVYTCVHKQACTLVTALMWMSEDGFWEGVFFFYHVDSGISSDLATSTFTCEPSHCSVCAWILDCFQQGLVLKLLLLVDVQFPQHGLSKRIVFCLLKETLCFSLVWSCCQVCHCSLGGGCLVFLLFLVSSRLLAGEEVQLCHHLFSVSLKS